MPDTLLAMPMLPFAITTTLKPPATQTEAQPVNEALAYWEIWKIKGL